MMILYFFFAGGVSEIADEWSGVTLLVYKVWRTFW
jgi:hypothetical protein